MSKVVWGVVKDGAVRLDVPFPEGTRVQVIPAEAAELPPELRAEIEAWDRASDKALELVERMAGEGESDEKG